MKLYTYWRSTASYRVRIALALKNVDVDHCPVHLVRGGGEHLRDEYRAINPQARVPTLMLDDGQTILQRWQSSNILKRPILLHRCCRKTWSSGQRFEQQHP